MPVVFIRAIQCACHLRPLLPISCICASRLFGRTVSRLYSGSPVTSALPVLTVPTRLDDTPGVPGLPPTTCARIMSSLVAVWVILRAFSHAVVIIAVHLSLHMLHPLLVCPSLSRLNTLATVQRSRRRLFNFVFCIYLLQFHLRILRSPARWHVRYRALLSGATPCQRKRYCPVTKIRPSRSLLKATSPRPYGRCPSLARLSFVFLPARFRRLQFCYRRLKPQTTDGKDIFIRRGSPRTTSPRTS